MRNNDWSNCDTYNLCALYRTFYYIHNDRQEACWNELSYRWKNKSDLYIFLIYFISWELDYRDFKLKMIKFSKSDMQTMTFEQKGEILSLWEDGTKVREIASKTGRSMDWISNVIEALCGTIAKEDAIKAFKNKKQNSSVISSRMDTKKKIPKKKVKSKRKIRTKRRSISLAESKTTRVQTTKPDKEKTIVDSLREHIDYVGE